MTGLLFALAQNSMQYLKEKMENEAEVGKG